MICPQPYSPHEICFYCVILWNAKFFRNESKATRAETPLLFVYSKVFLGHNTLGLLPKSDNTAQLLDFYRTLIKEDAAEESGYSKY